MLCDQREEEELTDDGHEGVEVANVEALARHVDEELHDSSSLLLLHGLLDKMEDIKTKPTCVVFPSSGVESKAVCSCFLFTVIRLMPQFSWLFH